MNDTEKVLIKMLKENTGTHFLDSGNVYGWNWQRNQVRQFKKEPSAKLGVDAYARNGEEHVYLNPTISVFHFLSEAVEYSSKIDREFQFFARRPEFKDEGWFAIAKAFAEYYAEKNGIEKYAISTFNSYNGEDYLSQVIQGVTIGHESGIVLLQIHGGCDVRGGYTKPHAFRYSNDWAVSLCDNARATIFCENNHVWDCDGGYDTPSMYNGADKPLKDYPSHVLVEGEQPVIGKLCGRDGEAFCPICASKLQAGR